MSRQARWSAFGHHLINEALLDDVENGSNFEKAGAVAALYWAGMSLSDSGTPTNFTNEPSEAQPADEDLPGRQPALCVAEEMGESLGAGDVLLEIVQQKEAIDRMKNTADDFQE